MDIDAYMLSVGEAAKSASSVIAAASTQQKNQALLAIAGELDARRAELIAANQQDLDRAAANGLEPALLDRLVLSEKVIDGMIEGLEQVAKLPDPVGQISDMSYRPSGIQVGKMRVPLGVIGIIYESRPNVTVEAASLCLKSGNAAILRGGSEASESNLAIGQCVAAGLQAADLPATAVQVIETTDRTAVGKLITMEDAVDVIVPRGGKGLIERISRDARVNVIKHLDGNCHVYIHDDADLDMASAITVNAKTQRYGTCNTAESLLIARSRAKEVLGALIPLFAHHQLELKLCEESNEICQSLDTSNLTITTATEDDWYAEYLAPILAVKIVGDLDEAVDHINRYSSQHTESIVTNNHQAAMRFLRAVDSSSVMINASTRFADGFEYGLGAEIGISTDKIHARGPVGLEGLTSQKYIVLGNGQIRQ